LFWREPSCRDDPTERGWIVNIASNGRRWITCGRRSVCGGQKRGALALFDSLAAELKPYNINVNSVLPSIIDTAVNRKADAGGGFLQMAEARGNREGDSVLCSEEAHVIHGAAIPV